MKLKMVYIDLYHEGKSLFYNLLMGPLSFNY